MNQRSTIVSISAAVCFLLVTPVCGEQSDRDWHSLAMQGNQLSEDEVKSLTRQVTIEDDLVVRAKLIGYYGRRRYGSADARDQHSLHVLWLIEHHPECGLMSTPYVSLNEHLENAAYKKARALWLVHVADDAASVRLLAHAAEFFTLADRPRAIQLVSRAAKLEPRNPDWPRRLGHLHSLDASAGPGNPAAKKALISFKRALELTEGHDRYYLLKDVAMMALLADEPEVARKHARELLDSAVESEADWNYGNAVHHGNLILGHLALLESDLDGAERYLLRAGKTPGSPQLNSFGPNMLLAKRLLENDRRDAVIQYLMLCGKFWKKAKTDNWIQVIESGGMPEFGGNLRY